MELFFFFKKLTSLFLKDKAPIAGVLLIDILTVAAEAVRKENCFAVYTRVRTYLSKKSHLM